MNSSLSWPPPTHRQARPWVSLTVLAGHVLVFWALVQLNLLEQVVRHAAPLMVQIVSPGREPAPEPLLKVAPPRVAPPPLLPTMPVPEIELREPPPAPTITVQAAAAPVTTPAPPAPAITPPPPAPPLPSILKVSAGSLRYLVEPALEVPRISRRLGELGTVTLRVVVDARGQPREVLLLHSSGFERLDQQALGAMRRARFVPCSQDGKPVECVFDAPIEYTLEN